MKIRTEDWKMPVSEVVNFGGLTIQKKEAPLWAALKKLNSEHCRLEKFTIVDNMLSKDNLERIRRQARIVKKAALNVVWLIEGGVEDV